MKILCEMNISDLFWLSTGEVAITGCIAPNIERLIPNNSKADLYIDNKKITTINIIGEDRFVPANNNIHKNKRAIRTNTTISENLRSFNKAKLIIFKN